MLKVLVWPLPIIFKLLGLASTQKLGLNTLQSMSWSVLIPNISKLLPFLPIWTTELSQDFSHVIPLSSGWSEFLRYQYFTRDAWDSRGVFHVILLLVLEQALRLYRASLNMPFIQFIILKSKNYKINKI